jgi:hypothetical protein
VHSRFDDLVSFGAISFGCLVSSVVTVVFLGEFRSGEEFAIPDAPLEVAVALPAIGLDPILLDPKLADPVDVPPPTYPSPRVDLAIIWDISEATGLELNFALIRDLSRESPDAVSFAIVRPRGPSARLNQPEAPSSVDDIVEWVPSERQLRFGPSPDWPWLQPSQVLHGESVFYRQPPPKR